MSIMSISASTGFFFFFFPFKQTSAESPYFDKDMTY